MRETYKNDRFTIVLKDSKIQGYKVIEVNDSNNHTVTNAEINLDSIYVGPIDIDMVTDTIILSTHDYVESIRDMTGDTLLERNPRIYLLDINNLNEPEKFQPNCRGHIVKLSANNSYIVFVVADIEGGCKYLFLANRTTKKIMQLSTLPGGYDDNLSINIMDNLLTVTTFQQQIYTFKNLHLIKDDLCERAVLPLHKNDPLCYELAFFGSGQIGGGELPGVTRKLGK